MTNADAAMVNDEQILSGFANLHQVILTGFDQVRAEFAAVRSEMRSLRSELRAEIRSEVSGLDNRMMRRFDRIEERLDDHERRITALEAR